MKEAAAGSLGSRRVDILGCPFDAVDMAMTDQFLRDAIGNGRQVHVTVGNVDMVMKARRDPRLARAFWESALTIVDGVPITWAAKFLNRPVKGRVAGIELVVRCAAISHDLRCGVALIGSSPEIAEQAAENMRRLYPKAILHVIPTPRPLSSRDSEALVEKVRAHGDRIVLVALGAPRQELWVKEYLPSTGANVGIGVGAAFDIISGRKPRAPVWMRRNGLEWLHRMRLEPRRLGRRYLIDDLPFFGVLLTERLRMALKGSKAAPPS